MYFTGADCHVFLQATSKEQSIRIASSGGLSEDQIQNMVKEAEANAEKDKAVRRLSPCLYCLLPLSCVHVGAGLFGVSSFCACLTVHCCPTGLAEGVACIQLALAVGQFFWASAWSAA